MNSIKFLQQKVNNLPISQNTKIFSKAPITPKASVSCKNSQTKFHTVSGKKSQNRDKSARTKKKLEIKTKYQSGNFNAESKTFMVRSPSVQQPQAVN